MTPDQIRRSWDDDDTPRSVFPEPLAERLTRENTELRAENDRLRTELDAIECQRDNWRTCYQQEQEGREDVERAHGAAEARLDALVADLRRLADDLAEFATNGEVSSGIAMGWREGVRIAEHNVRAVLDKHAGEQP